MNLLLILTTSLLCLFPLFLVKDKISRFFITTYIGYWVLSLIISTFNPYGLFEVQFETYFLLSLNVICFSFGFILNNRIKTSEIASIDKLKLSVKSIEKNKIFKLIILVATLFCIYLFYISLQVAYLTGSTDELRWNLNEVLFGGSFLLHIVFSLFLGPVFHICVVLFAFHLFSEKKQWIYIFIYFIYSLMYATISGGRLLYAVIFLEVVLVYVIMNYRNKLLKKKYVVLFVFSFVLLYSLFCFASARKRENVSFSTNIILEESNDINRSLVTYSIAPFRMLDYALHNDYLEKAGGYQYGRSTFQSIDDIINNLCSIIGIEYSPVFPKTTKYLGEQLVIVSNQLHPYNYAYTSLMMHYYDFGVFGIIIFPLLFGYFIRIHIINLYNRFNLFSLCIVVYLYYGAIYSIFTWFLIQLYSIIYILFLHFNSKKYVS